jgi:serine/threonine protein kinase
MTQHANSILHLDLKCSNVLLHWEDGKLMSVSLRVKVIWKLIFSPKALLSDFGTSEEMLKGKRERTGHTGTMAYMVRHLINSRSCAGSRDASHGHGRQLATFRLAC